MSEKIVREHDKFMLRLPDGMREALKRDAIVNKRSMNAEIVARLEASYALSEDARDPRISTLSADVEKNLLKIEDRVAALLEALRDSKI